MFPLRGSDKYARIQVASQFTGEAQLAPVAPVPAPVPIGPANKPAEPLALKAGPGHVYVCGHACILGAWHATKRATQNCLAGNRPADFRNVWEEEFTSYSQAAADAMTPIGGYMLRGGGSAEVNAGGRV